jgi:hypothetical protein
MKRPIASLCISILFILACFSCSPSKSVLGDEIHAVQSSWTRPPTYTYYPAYTNPPTTVEEITKVVVITETDAPTSIFTATLTPTKTLPAILSSGSGVMKAFTNKEQIPMSYFDLDTGTNGDKAASDIAFWVSCGSGCFPTAYPANGAVGFVFGRKEPGYEDCAENMTSEDIQWTFQYICLKTNSNNIAMFKIVLYCYTNADGTDSIEFIYKTWKSSEG